MIKVTEECETCEKVRVVTLHSDGGYICRECSANSWVY